MAKKEYQGPWEKRLLKPLMDAGKVYVVCQHCGAHIESMMTITLGTCAKCDRRHGVTERIKEAESAAKAAAKAKEVKRLTKRNRSVRKLLLKGKGCVFEVTGRHETARIAVRTGEAAWSHFVEEILFRNRAFAFLKCRSCDHVHIAEAREDITGASGLYDLRPEWNPISDEHWKAVFRCQSCGTSTPRRALWVSVIRDVKADGPLRTVLAGDTEWDRRELRASTGDHEFSALLRVLTGGDEDLAAKAVPEMARLVLVGNVGDDDVGERRLEKLVSTESERVLDVMFELVFTKYGWVQNLVLDYVLDRGQGKRLFQRWQQTEPQDRPFDILESVSFVGQIVADGYLPTLFEHVDQGKYSPSECVTLFRSLLELTVYDRMWGRKPGALSHITGNASVVLDILRHADQNLDEYRSFVEDLVLRWEEPKKTLRDALEDLLAQDCHERQLLDLLEHSDSRHARMLICVVLGEIGTAESLSAIDVALRRTGATEGWSGGTLPEEYALDGIFMRLDTRSLQQVAEERSGLIKKRAEEVLDSQRRGL